jgi:hypothetical protein
MNRIFAHNGSQREIGRATFHDGTAARIIKRGFYHEGGAVREIYRHVVSRGTMTQGSISQGTTTVTTRRGFVNGFTGSKVDAFGLNYDVLSTYQRTGASPAAIRTRFVVIAGPYLDFATVRVSLDGGATYQILTWASDSDIGESSYWVDGNVFNLTSGTNGTTFDVRVEWES